MKTIEDGPIWLVGNENNWRDFFPTDIKIVTHDMYEEHIIYDLIVDVTIYFSEETNEYYLRLQYNMTCDNQTYSICDMNYLSKISESDLSTYMLRYKFNSKSE